MPTLQDIEAFVVRTQNELNTIEPELFQWKARAYDPYDLRDPTYLDSGLLIVCTRLADGKQCEHLEAWTHVENSVPLEHFVSRIADDLIATINNG